MSNGIVGIIANDFARVSIFTACVFKLEVPDGWKKEMLIGGDWCGARNDLCQQTLRDGHSHLWFMDDDHAFPPQMLHKLLAHDKPLVSPICLTRVHPFKPVQYTERNEDNDLQYLPIPLSKANTDGLVEIQAGGCAGMLIRRDVLEAIEPPWFEYADRSEDIIFCEKAKAAGFDLYADLSLRLGHVTTAVVWPAVDGDRWVTGLNVGDLQLTVETAEEMAAQKPWIWELRSEKHNQIVVTRQERAPNEPVNWQPIPDDVPAFVMQWWVDENDGNGFHPVGDPFTYELKEG